jgi:hypothetical protein
MDEVISNPTQFIKVAVRYDFVVNEFPRIQVPAAKKAGPEDFRDMSKIQRQLIVKRLIDRVDEI